MSSILIIIFKPVATHGHSISKNEVLVFMCVTFVKIGDHCYHDLCDMGASISVFSFLKKLCMIFHSLVGRSLIVALVKRLVVVRRP